MITGVAAVAPSGDGAPIRIAVATSTSTSADPAASSPEQSSSVAKPESSSQGSSPRHSDSGDRQQTGQYLASLLAAQITGRPAAESRPARITPERLASLISYLESSVAATSPARSEDDHAVDVKS